MNLSVNSISNNNYRLNPLFKNKKVNTKTSKDENPITRKGETMKLVTSTFIAGVGLGLKLLVQLVEDGIDVTDLLVDLGKTISKKRSDLEKDFNKVTDEVKKSTNKGIKIPTSKNPYLSTMYAIGAACSILAAGLCGFALLYTAFKAPNINYKAKVNTFEKQKEMDVYTKANEAERELYSQLSEEAKDADEKRKNELKEQYMKLKIAKNQVPDFVELKKMPQ